MAAPISIQVLTGPTGSPRSGRIDAILRDAGGAARLLVPSVAQARARRESFLAAAECAGAWGMPVWSLTDFAHQLLEAEGEAVTRLSSAFQRSLIMEHCLGALAEAMPETHLARIPRSPGLVRHLLRVMNDLKQAAIEPGDFSACIEAAAYQTSFDEGVATLYHLFQDYLRAHGLYDVPGLYWRADEIARKGHPRILEGVETLLFDGFDDFTPSEFRFLESLLGRVKRGVVGLNLDDAPDRQDRYALPLDTLRKLRARFDCQVVGCEGPAPTSYSSYAAQHLFWREEPAGPGGLAANVSIVPCSDGIHEMETIARRIKGLIVEGAVTPGEIAVIRWDMGTVGETLRGVLAGFGIPCQLSVQRPLSETGFGRTLVNLLCNTGAWEREGILDLLASPYLRTALWGSSDVLVGSEGHDGHFVTNTGETPVPHSLRADVESEQPPEETPQDAFESPSPRFEEAPPQRAREEERGSAVPNGPAHPRGLLGTIDAAAYYTRRARILEGYRDWTFRLQRLRGQVARNESEDAAAILKRRPGAVAEIDGLLAAMERLHGLQQRLPAEETARVFAETVDGLIAEMDGTCIDGGEGEAPSHVRALLELLADAPDGDRPMQRSEFLERFSRGMDEGTVTLRGEPGGVVCLDAAGARNQRFAHVFVAGLMEGQVPATPAGNAVYPEHDRERLIDAGIPVETNQEHHARQRMLFGHVLECAEETLTLSWAVTQDSGRESSPSPFLTDVRELLPPDAVASFPRADSFLPAPALLASARDVANRALYDAPALGEAFPEICEPCVTGAAVEQERHSASAFGPFDGALSEPELVAAIAKDYGAQHQFSVAQLESYLACPFSFFTQRILHLEDTELPDGTVTPLVRGSLLHAVLQRFHEAFAGFHVRDIGLGKADEAVEALVAEVFAGYDWSESSAPPAARVAEQAHLLTRIQRYLRVEFAQEKEGGWKPAHFEVAFGRTRTEEDGPPSTAEPYAMALADGPVLFTGRIDRIDRDGAEARLIDYKSGSVPGSGEITGGQSLQLSVYAGAVEHLLIPGSRCTEARYLAVGKTERREALGLGQKRYQWPEREANMEAAIARAVDGIRRGYFPPVRAGKHCYGCGHARACRHEEARIARKSAIDESVEENA